MFVVALTTAAVIATIGMSGSALACQYLLYFSSRRVNYSARTLRLYRTFANVLLVEAAMAAATFGAPAFAAAYAYLIQSPLAGCLATTIFSGAIWYPTVTNFLIMCYVRPYRHAVLRILRVQELAKFVRSATKVDVSGAYHMT